MPGKGQPSSSQRRARALRALALALAATPALNLALVSGGSASSARQLTSVPNPCGFSPAALVAGALGVPAAAVSEREADTVGGTRDCTFCAVPASAHAGRVPASQCDITQGYVTLTVNAEPPPGFGGANETSGPGLTVSHPAGIGGGYLVSESGQHFAVIGAKDTVCRVITLSDRPAATILPLARYIYAHSGYCF
jgi:hypothetical protein